MPDLAKTILRKLFRRRLIGGKHTALEHITSGIPTHLHGDAKKAAQELIKERLIIVKPTSYGVQISLNPDKLDEIEKKIGEDL